MRKTMNPRWLHCAWCGALAAAMLPATAAADGLRGLVRSWQARLDNSELPKGELFRVKAGPVTCGAGYVYAIQSRVFTNSNDLEFWCRSRDVRLDFKVLPRASADLTTNVANLDGALYDYATTQVYHFGQRRWRPGPLPVDPKPYLVQGKPDALYVISNQRRNCPGLSVFADGAYLGTVKAESFSAAAVWQGRFIVNAGGIHAARLSGPTRKECAYLPTETLAASKMWAYGIYLTAKGTLLVGGDLPGYGRASDACHPVLLEIAQGFRREVPVSFGTAHCRPGSIKEFYSFSPWRGGVLIGNFPLGTLLRFDGKSVGPTRIAAPGPEDWFDPHGTYYRESQTVVNAYGATFVGVYPWAEVVTYDHVSGQQRSVRLISAPRKDAAGPTPYFWTIHERARRQKGVRFDPNAEVVYSLTRNGKSLRDEGQEPTRWGQRVSSVAVLSGRVCASTGSLAGDAYSASAHTEIPREVVEGYGRVSCALLPGHLLVPRVRGNQAIFRLKDNTMEIEVDGRVVARRAHGLSPDDLAALRSLR